MKNSHLREIVEITGVIGVIAALLLVAWEVRQSNRLAAAELEIRLAGGFNDINLIRATAPEFAKLFPKMIAPGNHLVTATEQSQLTGLAWHFVNLYYAAQVAHDNGLLGPERLGAYRQDLAQTLERFPGLHPAFLQIYADFPAMRAMPVFEPVRDLQATGGPAEPAAPVSPAD